MLLVFAHPDDESFAAGATVAKYVKAGWEVDLLCATRGQAGQTGPYGELIPNRIGEIRQKELEKAATLLGISTITFLGYGDGELAEEPPGELEDKIHEKMIELVPDCVITFDTTGLSNHPDHIRISYATTFAFQKYALAIEEHLEGTKDYTEEAAPKLYYACVPESVASYLVKKKIFSAESFGRPWVGVADKFITTVISSKGFELIKKRALLEHKTQQENVSRFFSLPKNPLMKQEYFIWRLHGTREIFMGNNDRVATKL